MEGFRAIVERLKVACSAHNKAGVDATLSELGAFVANELCLVVGDETFDMEEVELYLRTAAHDDVFAHCSEDQVDTGVWYFHKLGKGYKGGTYKGLDLAFGWDTAYAGILIRCIRSPQRVIEGPCLIVDYVLAKTGFGSIAEMVDTVWGDTRRCAFTCKQLRVAKRAGPPRELLRTPRVGLSLKRATPSSPHLEFIARPYRFVADLTLKKGRVHTIVSMHQSGLSETAIAARAKTTLASVAQCLAHFRRGAQSASAARSFLGKAVTPADLSMLFGALSNVAATAPATPVKGPLDAMVKRAAARAAAGNAGDSGADGGLGGGEGAGSDGAAVAAAKGTGSEEGDGNGSDGGRRGKRKRGPEQAVLSRYFKDSKAARSKA